MMEQRKRLQSVSLDGLAADIPHIPAPGYHPSNTKPTAPTVRRTMEHSLEDFMSRTPSMVQLLTQDLRREAKQPDLTRSLTPSPKRLSDSNASFETLRDDNALLRQEVDALTKKMGKMLKVLYLGVGFVWSGQPVACAGDWGFHSVICFL